MNILALMLLFVVVFSGKKKFKPALLKLVKFLKQSGITARETDRSTLEHTYTSFLTPTTGGAVASWLVRSSLDQAVWVRVLVEDVVFCS